MCHGTIRNIISELVHEKWSENAEDLIDFITNICETNFPLRLAIHTHYERECHREDVESVLKDLEIDNISPYDIDVMVTQYERNLEFDNDWWDIVREVIYDYLEEENE